LGGEGVQTQRAGGQTARTEAGEMERDREKIEREREIESTMYMRERGCKNE
jgi:hypothetical protein